jgi:hypothetical protein
MARILLACVLILACGPLCAQQSTYVWQKFADRIKASEAISPLGNDLFGDRVGLSKGELSFAATDLALPGNDSLRVALERQYSVFDRRWRTSSPGMMADWDLSLPSIGAVFASDWVVQPIVSHPVSTARCSVVGRAPVAYPFDLSDFWRGVTLNLPGEEAGEILVANSPVTLADGRTYTWVTGNGMTRLACLPTVKNGAGEGFLAVTPDGTRYWFDWMGQTDEGGLSESIYIPGQPTLYGVALKKTMLYATRVEDRFGNRVDYTYDNAWNARPRLTRIQATDGRTITLTYSGANISSATDGTRTWTYTYASTASGRTTLTQVGLPDGSRWSIQFQGFTQDGEIRYRDYTPGGEIVRTCTHNDVPLNIGNTFVGTLTHPSGAMGTFTMDIREHGRSNVPVSCRNVTTLVGQPNGSGNNQNDDVNLWAIKGYSFTLKQKRISGPGLATSEWNYSYVPGTSFYRYPGTTVQYPVCDWQNHNCSLPPCTSDSCAGASTTTVAGPGGEWVRYTHGNSYRYNEGKLLRVERGTSASNILQTTVNAYDLSLQNQVYPASFGESLSVNSDGFEAMFHRPAVSRTVYQDGTSFTSVTTAFDAFARPITVTRASAVVPAAPPPGTPAPTPQPLLATSALTVPGSAYTHQTFAVSWEAVADATYYVLESRTSTGSFSVRYSGAALTTSVSFAVVTSAVFQVKACNTNGCGEYSPQRVTVIRSSGGGGGIEP